MSWSTMANEIAGTTPVPLPLALTLVNRSWLAIQREFEWSFLYDTVTIPTLSPIAAGMVGILSGTNTVAGDADATAAWNAVGINLTQMQFRVGTGAFYPITAYTNDPDTNLGTLTLEKPFVDLAPAQGIGGYQLVQAYFNAPTPDFIWWESIRDPYTSNPISTTLTREAVDRLDPMRFQGGFVRGVLPFRVNPAPGTFYGWPQYEMWPLPQSGTTYIGSYFRRGLPFTKPTDTVLAPLGEDVVLAAAKVRAYEWCAANPDKCPKADYRFLMGSAQAEKRELLNSYILTDESFSHRHIIDTDTNFHSLPWISMSQELLHT